MHGWQAVHTLSILQGSNGIIFPSGSSTEMALQHSGYESFELKDEGIRFKITTRCLKHNYTWNLGA